MNYISKITLIGTIFCATVFASSVQAQKVKTDNCQRLQVEFITGSLKTDEVTLDGITYNTLGIEGYLPSSEVGQPDLPTFSRLIEVPLCKGFEVTVSNAVYDTLEAVSLGLRHPLLPLQPSRSKSDTLHHQVVVGSAYHTNAFYSMPLASVEAVGIARDRNLALLQFSPVSYNPVSGRVVICRSATVDIRYTEPDRDATMQLFDRYHTPAFGIGAPVLNNLYSKAVRTDAPIRYLIVAHSSFRGQLDGFIQWKRRKGFITDIVYTDSTGVGTTTTSIAEYIKSQYTNATTANPAPTYLLLVGDVEQIPAFTGTTDADHITDLYYTTWTTGDNIPDCYYGRFSAQNLSQLTPQIEKTLMYEQYTFADPSFLDRAVMVAGVDGGSSGDYGYTHADPTLDYVITHYVNGSRGFSQVRYFKNNTSNVPTATNVSIAGNANSMSATVRSYYNQGAGLINYTAHGSATSWGTPNFTTTHAAAMTNTQKFGLMIGNCCLTNKFETSTCLGESVLRKGNYCGAVGYIGGSNSTYWNEDFYWSVGLRSGISPTMSLAYNANNLGAYDRFCHTHNETHSQWVTTQGALIMAGNMAVQSSSSSLKHYYWEIYHLMGDPSLMPYMTQASTIPLSTLPVVMSGTGSLTVNTAPYAYVALTDTTTHTLHAAAFADAGGVAVLTLPASLLFGGYEVAASAQQYRTAFQNIDVIYGTESFGYVNSITASAPLNAGAVEPLSVSLVNAGNSTLRNVVLHLATGDPALTLSLDSIVLDSVTPNTTMLINGLFYAMVGSNATDGTSVAINAGTTWDNCQQPIVTTFWMTLQAPRLVTTLNNEALYLTPGDNSTLNVTMNNDGHAATPTCRLTLTSPTSMLTVTPVDTTAFSIVPGAGISRAFTLQASSQLPQNVFVPLHLTGSAGSIDTVVNLFTGSPSIETFEGSAFHLSPWTQGSQAWTFDNTDAHGGSYSLRSTNGLSHSQTSELTITHAYSAPDSISFYYKVSSEEGYDKFHFYIDGSDMLTESGTIDWTRAAFPVSTGNHTFKFSYAKDHSVSRGSDCAWIDDVVFPITAQAASFRIDSLCQGATYVLFGDTIDTQQPSSGSRSGTVGGTTVYVDYYVLPPSSSTVMVAACDEYYWNGTLYTADTTVSATLTTPYDCDSTVTLTLTVNRSMADTVTEHMSGDSFLWNGQTYTSPGIYQQVLTATNGCDSTITLILQLTSGIDEVEADALRLYPNPTTGQVSLSQPADEVRIYDMTGRQVALLRNVQQLDLGTLPAGVYTLRLSTSTGSATLRAIRQ
ncbi:MAG: T9SS type A sorting domain-containing protein [Bacteroidales bacterium]|nr:T9SS type A sorting domain-containing protein [Bacteroidales bacterium]